MNLYMPDKHTSINSNFNVNAVNLSGLPVNVFLKHENNYLRNGYIRKNLYSG